MFGDQRPYDINIAWEVLKKSKILQEDSNDELAQFVQALTGTMIIKSPASEEAGPQTSYKKNIIVENETLKAIMEGGSITVLACDEKDKCLNPTEKTITISESNGFKKRVSKAMEEMSSKLATGEKYEQKHIDIVTKTSIPIQKAMVVRQAYFRTASAASVINSDYYSSIVAVDMLYGYLDEILKSVYEQSKQVKNFDEENMIKFQHGVEKAREELAKYKIDSKDSFEQARRVIEETQKIESILAARIGNKLKGNLQWASKF